MVILSLGENTPCRPFVWGCCPPVFDVCIVITLYPSGSPTVQFDIQSPNCMCTALRPKSHTGSLVLEPHSKPGWPIASLRAFSVFYLSEMVTWRLIATVIRLASSHNTTFRYLHTINKAVEAIDYDSSNPVVRRDKFHQLSHAWIHPERVSPTNLYVCITWRDPDYHLDRG